MKLAAEVGYAGCMQTIFSSDAVALQAATSVGFLPVLYAPQNGNVNGRRCDSVMFFKWLSEDARKVSSTAFGAPWKMLYLTVSSPVKRMLRERLGNVNALLWI